MREKQKDSLSTKEKWYLDACILEYEFIYGEVLSKKSKEVFIGHLALGEAFGACLEKGEEQVRALMELMEKLSKINCVNIVGHDSIGKQLRYVREHCELKMADAIHLATALKKKCCKFRSIDSDFTKMPKSKIHSFGEHFEINNFAVTGVKHRK